MTGITEIVRSGAECVKYWQGRLGLLLLLSQLVPTKMQGTMKALLMPSTAEIHAFENPIGRMPIARPELFQERRSVVSNRAAGTAPRATLPTLPGVMNPAIHSAAQDTVGARVHKHPSMMLA